MKTDMQQFWKSTTGSVAFLALLFAVSTASCVFGILLTEGVANADTLTVHNRDANGAHVLTDLAVTGTIAGQPGTVQDILLKTGFATPPAMDDDRPIPAGGTAVFFTEHQFSKITSVTYSEKSGLNELPSKAFSYTLDVAKLIPIIDNPTGGPTVFLSYDDSLYTFQPPSEGTIVSFGNGVNSGFPGWFVGTQLDPVSGDVTNPFTGSVRIFDTSFQVTVQSVPEPSTLTLMGLGGLFYLWRWRKWAA